ncbi:MAG: M48 family metalloprotease [Planctomycetota bacterium]
MSRLQASIIVLVVSGLAACSTTFEKLAMTVSALEEAKVSDQLEPSESYNIGRAASAVIVDSQPMANFSDEATADRIVYLNLIGGYVEATSKRVTRSSGELGSFVERSYDQQERVDESVLYKGVQIGLLADEDVAAYGTPGGFIWITQGALDLCRNEDEVAALISIQLAHIVLEHPLTCYRLEDEGRILEPTGDHAAWFAGNGLGANFGRLVVTLADAISYEYYETPYNLEAESYATLALLQAGYEPRAVVSVLTAMSLERQQTQQDWLKRQSDLDARVASAAQFIADHEMQVHPSWKTGAPARQQRFNEVMAK